MKIKVKPEGRDGVWLPNKDSLIDFLLAYEYEEIHNYMTGSVLVGADHVKESVIKDVKEADRLAILTGDSLTHNMGHALSVIKNNMLLMFYIGEITEDDLIIEAA